MLVSKNNKILMLFALCLLLPCLVYSKTVTFDISATVDTISDNNNVLRGKISVGDTITGSYTYDDTTPDSNALPTVGDYQHTSSPAGITIEVNGITFKTDSNNIDFLVELSDDHGNPSGDNYLLRSYNNTTSESYFVEHISWQLDDPSTQALSSSDLTAQPPVLADWQSIFGLTISGCLVPNPSGSCRDNDYLIRAHVDTITIGMIPSTCSNVAVSFQGKTNCNKRDGGFDNTNSTQNPPWISVAVGEKTKVAEAVIVPSSNVEDVKFSSADIGKVEVRPGKAKTSPQILRIQGLSSGETTVDALVNQNVCKSFNVAVYKKRNIKVGVHIVQTKTPAGGQGLCPAPQTKISGLQKSVNRIWDQAAIKFSMKSNRFIKNKAIESDFDGDCRVDILDVDANGNPVLHKEAKRIHNAARDSRADVNIYFVKGMDIPSPGKIPVGISLRIPLGPAIIFVIGGGDQNIRSTELLTAHELGHDLGLFHCDESRYSIDNLCAQEGKQALMHSENVGCAIHKPEWDCANSNIGCAKYP